MTFIDNSKKSEKSKEETMFRVTIDNKLTFNKHIKRICKKACQELPAVSRILAFINLSKKQV